MALKLIQGQPNDLLAHMHERNELYSPLPSQPWLVLITQQGGSMCKAAEYDEAIMTVCADARYASDNDHHVHEPSKPSITHRRINATHFYQMQSKCVK